MALPTIEEARKLNDEDLAAEILTDRKSVV